MIVPARGAVLLAHALAAVHLAEEALLVAGQVVSGKDPTAVAIHNKGNMLGSAIGHRQPLFTLKGLNTPLLAAG